MNGRLIGVHEAVEPSVAAIPERWEVRRFKAVLDRLNERNDDLLYPMLSLRSTGDVVLRSTLDARQEPDAGSLPRYLVTRVADLVVNPMWLIGGGIGISALEGAVSPDYRVFRPSRVVEPRFLHYLLRSRPYLDQYVLYTRAQTTFDRRVQQGDLDNLPLLIPPLNEQQQIALYLDHETARIDALIEEQQRLVEMLGARKAAVIDAVATRGLDAAVELTDSGTDWLGPVPRHWTVRPLWTMFERIKDVDHPDEQMLSVFRDFGVVAKSSRQNINKTAENRSIYQLVHPGWLVTNRMKAWQGSVGISGLRGIVSGHYLCFAPLHREHDTYLNLLFRSPRYAVGYGLISRGVRIGQAEIDNDDYRVMPVLIPPIDEQYRIAEFIDEQTAKINTLIAETERFVELARERRSALITAAVTGQIDTAKVA